MTGDKDTDQKIQSLFEMLPTQTGEVQRYGLMEQLISLYRNGNHSEELKLFLNQYIRKYPQDSYNCYYILVLGTLYEEEGAGETASVYFNRLLTNFDDLIIKGSSVHLYTLNKLIAGNPTTLQKIEYYQELISRFPSEVDRGLILFRLAKAYEEEGALG